MTRLVTPVPRWASPVVLVMSVVLMRVSLVVLDGMLKA
jgi:hypothetical protein